MEKEMMLSVNRGLAFPAVDGVWLECVARERVREQQRLGVHKFRTLHMYSQLQACNHLLLPVHAEEHR